MKIDFYYLNYCCPSLKLVDALIAVSDRFDTGDFANIFYRKTQQLTYAGENNHLLFYTCLGGPRHVIFGQNNIKNSSVDIDVNIDVLKTLR